MNEQLNGLARSNALGAAVVLVIRAIIVAVGLVMMAVGLVFAPLPIPLGLPLFVLGMILTAAASKTLHRFFTNILKRFPWLWRRIRFAFGEKGEAAE